MPRVRADYQADPAGDHPLYEVAALIMMLAAYAALIVYALKVAPGSALPLGALLLAAWVLAHFLIPALMALLANTLDRPPTHGGERR